MLPNRQEKNMVIPIIVVKGEFYYFYGGRLPIPPDGTMCDLIVPAYAIKDKDFLEKLEAGHVEELLPVGAHIFTAISSRQLASDLSKSTFSAEQLAQRFGGSIAKDVYGSLIANNLDSLFVEVILEEPLMLELRGTKHGRLRRVRCVIPELNEKASSLNHAYRLISEHFEPDRISHAGNVFRKMVHLDEGVCDLLDELRDRFEAKHARALQHPGLPKGEYYGPEFPLEQSQ